MWLISEMLANLEIPRRQVVSCEAYSQLLRASERSERRVSLAKTRKKNTQKYTTHRRGDFFQLPQIFVFFLCFSNRNTVVVFKDNTK